MKRFVVCLLVAAVLTIPWGFIPKVDAGDNYWVNTYRGDNNDWLMSIQQTTDGGYIIGGYTDSFGAGGFDVLVMKLDVQGNISWSKVFGGLNDDRADRAFSIQQTTDGGYIIGGYTDSFGAGGFDVLVMKLDTQGNISWSKVFGGLNDDGAYFIQQTTDGGYIIGGTTSSFGAGGFDVLVMKLDAQGNISWSKVFGGSGRDVAHFIQQTTDGGYIIGGYTDSFGAGYYDILVMKLDDQCNISWSKVFGTSNWDFFSSIQQTTDGGYIIGGHTKSWTYLYDLVMKLDTQGDISWSKVFGWSKSDIVSSIQQTTDGGYIIGGVTKSLSNKEMDIIVMHINDNNFEEAINECGFYGINTSIMETNVTLLTSNENSIHEANPTLRITTPKLSISDALFVVNTLYKSAPTDTTPPVISISSPQDGSYTNQISIVLKGSVADDLSGVNSVFVNGEMINLSDADGNFSQNLNLVEGENIIDIVAEDNAGNRVEKDIKVIVDTFPPQITLTSSIPSVIHQASITISGSATDIRSGINTIQINGNSVVNNSTFSYTLSLTKGLNQIIILAQDNAGNKSRLEYSTTYIPTIILKLQIAQKIMYVDDNPVFLDVAPVIIENRTLLPIRWIAEPLGAQVSWNSTERKVIVTLKDTTIELWIGKSIAKVNGIDALIDSNNPKVVLVIINSRTMLPLRFIAESLGCDVQWDGKTKTITITYIMP